MAELLEKEQVISIVPKNFKNSNKCRVLDIQEKNFVAEVFHSPDGVIPKNILEFYSQTKNGMLYFSSYVTEIEGNLLTIAMPLKHRLLQRRTFSRVKFNKEVILNPGDKDYSAEAIDLSAGGVKIKTKESLNIDAEYNLCFELIKGQNIECKYQIIKIEKNEEGVYTLSGRFKNLDNADKMILIQFCMKKNIENMKR